MALFNLHSYAQILCFLIHFNNFRGFKKDCPDGQLHKEKVLEMYSMILPEGNARVFVDQIFRIFDEDANGSIDFKVKIVNLD